jgi:hypothetical protein
VLGNGGSSLGRELTLQPQAKLAESVLLGSRGAGTIGALVNPSLHLAWTAPCSAGKALTLSRQREGRLSSSSQNWDGGGLDHGGLLHGEGVC